MSASNSQDLFRQAAQAEGGMAISAGARLAHVRRAIESGRSLYVDLSAVPQAKREALVETIKELVNRASTTPQQQDQTAAPDA